MVMDRESLLKKMVEMQNTQEAQTGKQKLKDIFVQKMFELTGNNVLKDNAETISDNADQVLEEEQANSQDLHSNPDYLFGQQLAKEVNQKLRKAESELAKDPQYYKQDISYEDAIDLGFKLGELMKDSSNEE